MLGGLALLLGLVFWLIRYPSVQTWLVVHSEEWVERALDAEVSIGEVQLALPLSARLVDLSLQTEEGEFIGSVKRLDISLLSFSIWQYLLNETPVHDLQIRSIEIDGIHLPVARRMDGKLNILAWLGPSSRKKKPSQRPLRVQLQHLELRNSRFSYVDSLKLLPDSLRGSRFNERDMHLSGINFEASCIIGPGRAFSGDIRHLSVQDSLSGLALHDFAVGIRADTTHERDARGWKEIVPFVDLTDIVLEEGESKLFADFHFPRTELRDILRGDLLDRYLEATWTNSVLHTGTIQRFVSEELPIEGSIWLEGTTTGSLADLYSPDVHLRFGNKTDIRAKFRLIDLLHYQRTDLDIQLVNGQMNMADLRYFLKDPGIPASLDSVTFVDFQGRFKGHYEDFFVDFATLSEEGRFQADLHLVLPPKVKEMTYEGTLQTEGLNLRALGFRNVLDSRLFNAFAVVKGSGLSVRALQLETSASVWNSDLWGRQVDSLSAELVVDQKRVTGKAWGFDKGAKADVQVDLDFAVQPASYVVRGGIFQVDLSRYGLWESPLLVNTRIAADFSGDSLEQVAGSFVLNEFSLLQPSHRPFSMHKASLNVTRNSTGQKVFEVVSPMLDANLRGNFTLQKIGRLANMLAEESKLYFSNDDSLITGYYSTKLPDSLDTQGSFRLVTKKDLNSLLAFFDVPVQVAEGSRADTDFTFGTTEIAEVNIELPWVQLEGAKFESVSAGGQIYKAASDNKLALLVGLASESLDLGEGRKIGRISVEVEGVDDRFTQTVQVQQNEQRNTLRLLSETQFLPDGRIVNELGENSLFVANGDTLVLMSGNSLTFHNGILDIQNIILQSDASYLRLDGLVSENPQDVLTLSVAQIPVGIVSDFTDFSYKPDGLFNVEVRMQQLLTDPCMSIVSRIDDFSLDGFEYGDVFTEGHWQSSNGHLQLDAALVDEQDSTLQIFGYYDLLDTLAPLHFNVATAQSFPFDYLYPFVKTQLYELQGSVELEQFSLTGSLAKPVVLGTGHFSEAGFGVDYFKTKYTFEGSIVFQNDRIRFPRIQLFDQNKHPAILYGFILHKGLTDFEFDLQMEGADNFLLMNTTKKDNSLFYGRLVLKEGLGSVTGDLNKLKLDMVASSGRGSFLRIPLEDESTEGRPDFIRFSGDVQPESNYSTGLKDFEINLQVAMTPDLEVDLIFDERAGDIIRGRGTGNLNLFINEAGEFTMSGEYEIIEGNYLFTAQNIINKKFLVRPGGTIVWSGDPYDAQLNLDAYYPLQADISQLLGEEQALRTAVNVNMAMKGSLLAPAIDLAIELPNLTEGDASQIASYLKSIQYDDQELNKQVFSLMVFNRFAPVGGFLGANAAGTGVTTSISELVSNQLNYWLGQAIGQNVNVGVATNNFQDVNLLLSASLFNDRVVIERDGTLIDDNANLAIGNVSVQIKLLPPVGQTQAVGTRPSELVLEVFTRESLDAQVNNNTNQTGLGIFYKKDFDKLGELFERRKRK